MWEWLTTEAGIRLAGFGCVFLAMAAWEFVAPRRKLTVGKRPRWGSHLGLVAVNTLFLRLVAPLGAVGVALIAEAKGWGLLQLVPAPQGVEILLSILVLDLAIYFQHVVFHAVPLFWRLHMVHHADLDFDVTTGLRFHTLEILLSLGIKSAVVVLLGPPAVAVLAFEVLLNATSLFNHSNIRMPLLVDRIIRSVVVTPDMHRVHHSLHPWETNSNFGFSLSWWDHLFGTYRAQPVDGHTQMTIGLSQMPDPRLTQPLRRILWLPFSGRSGHYPITRRRDDVSDRPARAVPDSDALPEIAEHSRGGLPNEPRADQSQADQPDPWLHPEREEEARQ